MRARCWPPDRFSDPFFRFGSRSPRHGRQPAPPVHTEAAVERAVTLLAAGAVVAIPTETVYGLAADALDADAVERIFAAKGRPATTPLIMHVAGGRR
ncbi:MAG: L-threonylcarbamoyladenylate synthase [Planctomycetia bacterium]